MTRKKRGRAVVILLWIILSLVLYRCSVPDTVNIEEAAKEETAAPPVMDEMLRVLIKTDHYAGLYHQCVTFSGTKGLYIEEGERLREIPEGESYTLEAGTLTTESVILHPAGDGRILLENVARQERAEYRGTMECFTTKQGLIVVNELSVEEYLYGVVPSEMPASYPAEALKAQAVSARTYAFYHKQSYVYPEWRAHVDDSTAYQVYQNISEQPQICEAVDETRGLVMTCGDELIESFYYSTSWGYSTGYDTWKENETKDYLRVKQLSQPSLLTDEVNTDNRDEQTFRQLITAVTPSDYIESGEAWFRWHYDKAIAAGGLLERVLAVYDSAPDKVVLRAAQGLQPQDLLQEQTIRSITVEERCASGMVTRLGITTERFHITVLSQYCIRTVLATPQDTLTKQDGSAYQLGELLPSAFFYFDEISENGSITRLLLHGGGMGHGVGMSQNGAKQLAQTGMGFRDILNYFYDEIAVEVITF